MKLSDNAKQGILRSWYIPIIHKWKMEDTFDEIIANIINEYNHFTVYPPKKNVFKVFRKCKYQDVKVVMLFQDPYHDGSATGIAVGNSPHARFASPTLLNLEKEWKKDLGAAVEDKPFDRTLVTWCKQGVLMLNCALTVEKGVPKSHITLWRRWTEDFLVNLSSTKKDIIYILAGRESHAWREYIIHGYILKIVHPAAEAHSGGTSGFFGCRVFSKVNKKLKEIGKTEIEW